MAREFNVVPLPIIYAIDFCETKLGHRFPLPEQNEEAYYSYESFCKNCQAKLSIVRYSPSDGGAIMLNKISLGRGSGIANIYPNFWCPTEEKPAAYCSRLRNLL